MTDILKSNVLSEGILAALKEMGIEQLTEIQQKMIPEALEGQDIVARSQTGTGKTLAFLLPLLSKIQSEKKGLQALVVAPTQELAMQIVDVTRTLTAGTGIKLGAFIGGANINRQLDKLKKEKPQIAIGTPGRILELIDRKKLKVHEVEIVAIDEADRMVAEDEAWKNFTRIAKRVGRERQYLFVSATIPPGFHEMVQDFAPFIVQLESEGNLLVENVDHYYIKVEERNRIDTARKIIHADNIKKGIVFVNQLERLNETFDKLDYRGIKVAALSSEQNKQERERALKQFRDGDVHVLIATDVASRGLDVDDVTHIIQLDPASDPNSYLHRAGRTGRMGKDGIVLSLIAQKDEYKLAKYERELGATISEVNVSQGSLYLNKNEA
ncbi:DEAD/DEAH box helicase [Alkalihalobacillus pseudalcaliphilus]|uniref:DEAD/DEAH box helicase n=1 Tax=Alkalihalobacillus pseudalcaliphilus TaxID=79884 RepID=UPI00064DC574|nr:DEAD/DEAH box helicase [Alkalihalobacillus pseudalcaliphilus]KMK77690.1 RNA helicase [Alkalihalobacillus pseudalcaliphilus]